MTQVKFYRVSQKPTNLGPADKGSIYFIPNDGIYLYNGDSLEAYSLGESGDSLPFCLHITYSELKEKKDAGQLIPGMQYRIVDYVTLTKVSDAYTSAGHQFDIIVTADSTNTLNENVRAVQHEGDTYFANSNLTAWKLKYKLDNDTTYMWIDNTCKGVIYEMTDEFDNTFHYDFKNILQPRFYLTNTGNNITNNRYFGWYGHANADSSKYIMCYTFAREDNLNEDLSLNQSVINGNKVVVSNVKLKSIYNIGDSKYINDIVFLHSNTSESREEWRNISIGVDCYNMTIGGHCYNATISNYSHGITLEGNNRDFKILDWCTNGIIGDGCRNFQIASNCTSFIIHAECFSFTIGNECNSFEVGTNNRRFNVANYCRDWKSGANCQIWSIGNNGSNWRCGEGCSFWSCGEQCYQWSTGSTCTSWSVGNSCNGWSTGNNCKHWSTGNECYGWTVGNECSDWSTGNCCYNWSTKDYCQAWSVGNNCHTWSVGNHCIAWKAGNRCYNWVFGGQGAPKDYFNSITIESYNHNFALNTVYTTSSSKICRGIHIAEMAFASLTDWTNYGLTEGNGNVNQLYCTTIGKSGDKKLNVS